MAWIYPTLFIICLFMVCRGQEISERRKKIKNATFVKLADYLMDGYNKAIRPVQNWKQTTTVQLDVILYAILGVDEKNQLVSFYIWYTQTWKDEFLTWDPMKFDNVTKMSLPTHMVWVPDISVDELVDEEKPREISFVYIHNDGKIYNNKPMHILASCSLNIYYFPFDRQNCSLTFTSWTHRMEDIDLAFSKAHLNHESDIPSYQKKEGEWEVISISPKYISHTYEHSYGEVTYFFVIKRRPLFHTITLIFPSMLLMIIDVVGFYLPSESGERVSFKITLLLGYSVFLIIVSDKLPATGSPLIGVYVTMCMLFLVISLMESIIIVRIVHKQSLHPEIPKWLKKLVLEILAPLVCLKELTQFTTSREQSSTLTGQTERSTDNDYNNGKAMYEIKQQPVGQDSELLLDILKEVECIREHVKNSQQEDITREWIRIAYIIDILLFRTYLTFLLVCAISFGCIWARWKID